MNNINLLIELGGASMIAILIASVVMLATVLAKLIQFTKNRYWSIASPTKEDLATALSGLKIIEIVSIIAPLLGLLGTVLGMISAFQAMETAGGAAEIDLLSGGIWRALSTTAAGMVVAIIATIFLGVFDGAIERMSMTVEERK